MSSIKDLSYPHQQLIEAMKNQLIIALVRRLGGEVVMPVSEVDNTGGVNLAMAVEGKNFRFSVVKKAR